MVPQKWRVYIVLWMLATSVGAQSPNDSTGIYRESFFGMGFGLYSGTAMVFSTKERTFQNIAGYNNGVLVNAQLRLNNYWNTHLELRYAFASSSLSFNDQFLPYYFLLQRNGLESVFTVNRTVFTRKQKKLLNISVGAGYGMYHYQTQSDTEAAGLTSLSQKVSDSKRLNNFILQFGIRKSFTVSTKLGIGIFTDWAIMVEEQSLSDLSQVGFWRPQPIRESGFRLGLLLQSR